MTYARQELEKLHGSMDLAVLVYADKVRAVLDRVIEYLRTAERGIALGTEWMSLTDAKLHSGKSDSYFRAKLDCFEGRSRLEMWQEKGLARQEGRQWFVAASVVPPPETRWDDPPPNAVPGSVIPKAPAPDSAGAMEAIYHQLLQFEAS